MKEIFEIISTGFVQFGEWISLLLDIISVICIIIGIIVTLIMMFKLIGETTTPLHNRIRMKFGGWLVLALEFQLASDIVKTTLSPIYENLSQRCCGNKEISELFPEQGTERRNGITENY